jgi:hypothetical protein
MSWRRVDTASLWHTAACLIFVAAFVLLSGAPAYSQNKAACELVSKADAKLSLA